jgi:hypothetical protein
MLQDHGEKVGGAGGEFPAKLQDYLTFIEK